MDKGWLGETRKLSTNGNGLLHTAASLPQQKVSISPKILLGSSAELTTWKGRNSSFLTVLNQIFSTLHKNWLRAIIITWISTITFIKLMCKRWSRGRAVKRHYNIFVWDIGDKSRYWTMEWWGGSSALFTWAIPVLSGPTSRWSKKLSALHGPGWTDPCLDREEFHAIID